VAAWCAVEVYGQPDGGVEWINPPTAEELAGADEVEFVVAAREPIGEDPSEFIASVWEVRTGGGGRVTPRIHFARSSWSPGLLAPYSSRRDLIRVQVDDRDGTHGYRVCVYGVDYRDWSVETVWQGDQAAPVLWWDGEVYVSLRERPGAGERLMVVRGPELVEPVEQFECIPAWGLPGGLFLVRREEAGPFPYALFDAAAQQVTTLEGLGADALGDSNSIVVRKDRRVVALHTSRDIDLALFDWSALHKGQPTPSVIRVVRLADGRVTELPITLVVAPGSGEPLLFDSPLISFGGGALCYMASPTEYRWFDPETGTDRRVGPDGVTAPRPGDARSPDALDAPQPPLAVGPTDDYDKAHAFLRSHGVEYTEPTADLNSVLAFTPDGGRFLLKMFHSGRDEVFFLGDLGADKLVEIPCPGALVPANAMEIWAVRVGE
jgi:hypothetical protein